MLIDPNTIIVGERTRKDMGNLQALADSIVEVGLLHPPVVTSGLQLVAGERRLAAIKLLGWEECEVRVASNLTEAVDFLKAERDENTCRKGLAPGEAVVIAGRIRTILEPEAEARKAEGQKAGGESRQESLVQTLHQAPSEPAKKEDKKEKKTRDKAGESVGMSGETLRKAEYVVAAAKRDPETFGQYAVQMDKSGKVDRAYKAVKQIEQAEARAEQAKSIEADPALILGDFRTAGGVIADNSADLIFTDPPYNEKAVELYRDLSAFAARVLKPGGVCLAYSGHAHLPEVMQALASSLTYGWTCAIRHTGGELRFRNLNIRNAWKPVLMFYKPPLDLWWDWFSDMTTGGMEKDSHEWQQAESEAAHFIKALCPVGGICVDPFAGSGTSLVAAKKLGLRYIGFEIEEDAYNKAQARLSDDGPKA